jgi:hypothetical protein
MMHNIVGDGNLIYRQASSTLMINLGDIWTHNSCCDPSNLIFPVVIMFKMEENLIVTVMLGNKNTASCESVSAAL